MTSLIGLFEKRRFRNFLSYLAKYDEKDPSTFGGTSLSHPPTHPPIPTSLVSSYPPISPSQLTHPPTLYPSINPLLSTHSPTHPPTHPPTQAMISLA